MSTASRQRFRRVQARITLRRCELAGARRDLLDLNAGTLAIETTRVVVDGRVIESDGKTDNSLVQQRSARARERRGQEPVHKLHARGPFSVRERASGLGSGGRI